MLAHVALVIAAAVQAPAAAPSATPAPSLGGALHVDVGTVVAGPLAPSVAHLAPGKPGGTEVTLYNENTRESLTAFIRFDGLTDAVTADQLKSFFRCKRTGRQRAMYPGTLAVFSQVAAHYPGKVIEIISGVRAPGYGVKDSKHYVGHAIDFRVRGVKTRLVRDFVWSFDEQIGVGHYIGEDFLHVDQRPGEGKFAWEQRRQGSARRNNPRWATRTSRPADAARDEATAAAPKATRPRPARTLRSSLPTT